MSDHNLPLCPKLVLRNCYRCNRLGHRSNICPKCRSVNLIEDIANEGDKELPKKKMMESTIRVNVPKRMGSEVAA